MKRKPHTERWRVTQGHMASLVGDGDNGMFVIPYHGETFTVLASDGMGWDHVSVSTRKRCPTWDEMCAIKKLFFAADEVVVQFHPAEKDYVNCHPFCLHMWRWQEGEFPVPLPMMVGPR